LVLTGTTGLGKRAGARWRGWLVLLWFCLVPHCLADSVAVEVKGVSAALARNVERHVGQLGIADRESARRQRTLVIHHTRKALEALGYYAADVQFTLSPPERTRAEITLDIKPGKPVIWQDTRVTFVGPGMDDPLFSRIVQTHGPKVGDVLNHQAYETLKKELRTQALSNGYFDVQLRRHKLLIDRVARTARLDLELFTGERYRFGNVRFTATDLNDEALQRLVPFREGDFYEEAKVTELNRNLLDTGYFRTVGLFPRQIRATNSHDAVVPIDVELEDNDFNRVSVGLGFGTDTGPRVRMNWLMPMLNQYGHSLQFATSLSEPRREFTSEYKIPDGKPGTDFWSVQGGYLEEIFEDNRYRQISSGISRQEQVWADWSRTYFVKFKREQGYIEGNEVATTLPSDAFFITPGISFSRLKVDGGMRPRSGHKLNLDLEFSDPSIGSDTEYVRLSGLAKLLAPLSERQQILLRLQLGMLWSQDFDQVPVSTRFYAGGDQSIRGFDYNTLGPRNENDALIGGSKLGVVSAEYLYQFRPNWKAALFVDHGGAMDESNEPIDTGAGFGVRWLSPLGMISFDVAQALTEDEKPRIHITMGTVL
jgi:translocation and assembly module TamA